jgi:hypothetical protein
MDCLGVDSLLLPSGWLGITTCGVGAWERVGVARCETSAGSLTFFTRLGGQQWTGTAMKVL